MPLLIMLFFALIAAGFVIGALAIERRHWKGMYEIYKKGYDERGEAFDRMTAIAHSTIAENEKLLTKLRDYTDAATKGLN